MTIDEMRALVALPGGATDAEVVFAFAALLSSGQPASITLVEPVTVEQARQQCRIDDDVEDGLIAQKISSAREWVEEYTGRIVAQRALAAHFRAWGSYLELSKRPIISVDAIAYNGLDGDGVYADAVIALWPDQVRIYPGPNGFPALSIPGRGIIVAYTAGYEAASVPHSMIEAILVLVGGMMSEREGVYDKSLAAAESLVQRMPAL